jgi:hypothetical protein
MAPEDQDAEQKLAMFRRKSGSAVAKKLRQHHGAKDIGRRPGAHEERRDQRDRGELKRSNLVAVSPKSVAAMEPSIPRWIFSHEVPRYIGTAVAEAIAAGHRRSMPAGHGGLTFRLCIGPGAVAQFLQDGVRIAR